MSRIKKNFKNLKKQKLVFGCYEDTWEGCSKLLDDIYRTTLLGYNKANSLYKNNYEEHMKKFISFEINNDSKINPAFFPLIETNLNFEYEIKRGSKWEKIDNLLKEKLKEKNQKIKDIKGREWLNVNSIYPNYENKGTIAIKWIDSEDLILLNTNKIKNQRKKSWNDYSAEIANVLVMLGRFTSNKNLKLNSLEQRAIKFIAGEVIANTFQHAFKEKGLCSIGIFLRDKNKKITMTISDMGLSIPNNVRKYNKNKKSISDSGAIEWALGKWHTTKAKKLQGGMGLYRVKKIVEDAKGEFAFRSLNGIYHFKNGKIKKSKNYYENFGTLFYVEFILKNLDFKSLSISKEEEEEIKEVFLDENY